MKDAVHDYMEELESLNMSKYKQVIIASKYARLLNQRLEKQRLEEEPQESEEKQEAVPAATLAAQALQAFLDGKIEYEEPEKEAPNNR
jgi:DNA-directed RNA polymerase subunit K/omega